MTAGVWGVHPVKLGLDPLHQERQRIGSNMPGCLEENHLWQETEKGLIRKYKELPQAPLEGAQIVLLFSSTILMTIYSFSLRSTAITSRRQLFISSWRLTFHSRLWSNTHGHQYHPSQSLLTYDKNIHTRTTKDEEGFFGQEVMVTAHFFNENFQMVDMTIVVPHIQGQFLSLFNHIYFFCQTDGNIYFKTSLHTITANNASTNSQMGCKVQNLIPLLTAPTKYMGCIAHVINLGAKASLDVLGILHDPNHGEITNRKIEDSPGSSIMSISNLTTITDGLLLNLKTIFKRIHGWLLHCAIKLCQLCAHFCNNNAEVSKFKLMDMENFRKTADIFVDKHHLKKLAKDSKYSILTVSA
ncbi:hypothetical protein VP01_3537g1 [Puccinia sorghi]|uniref:Uncharacterized protein n=1 Tax=Puccinia sorghi TaxID=27349 RepID=A0A0L6UVG5_9BASI|nr:hypothetical protein VP01_3537g1 [Puccinia sorghi]